MQEKIFIEQGDITEMDVDAIVNSANTELILGAGVARTIRAKGGPTIQEECDKIGDVDLGGAAITGAGQLKARHVIHAAGMILGGVTQEDSLRACTASSLKVAAENDIHTIAFPAIGCGIGGFPAWRAAEIMFEETCKHLEGDTPVTEVHFVLFDERTLGAFQSAWKERTGEKT